MSSKPVAFAHQAGGTQTTLGYDPDSDTAPTLAKSQTVAVAFSYKDSGADAATELAPTLRSMTHDGSHANGGGHVAVAFAQNQRDEVRQMDVAGALASEPGMKQQTYVAFEPGSIARNAGPSDLSETVSTLRADMGDNQPAATDQTRGSPQAMAVRRLTPREAERLQGFPDDYTLVPHRGKPAADGPRYKALGNSMAVPCMHWIGKRIAMVHEMIGGAQL